MTPLRKFSAAADAVTTAADRLSELTSFGYGASAATVDTVNATLETVDSTARQIRSTAASVQMEIEDVLPVIRITAIMVALGAAWWLGTQIGTALRPWVREMFD